MTSPITTTIQRTFRLPDPPEREPDEVTSHDHLSATGMSHYLAEHLGNPETTLVTAERYIVQAPGAPRARRRRPDLLIAFDVDPVAYRESNGYIISEQGKPPDFVMEIASESTAAIDVGDKRDDYAELGIAEYWRFDETGEHHGDRLAGDLLIGGTYHPIPIEQVSDNIWQGYSAVLGLNIRWDSGRLEWHDPARGRHIITMADERGRADIATARADIATARADSESARADIATARADSERIRADSATARADIERIRADRERDRADGEQAARISAEARVRELEEELRRRGGE